VQLAVSQEGLTSLELVMIIGGTLSWSGHRNRRGCYEYANMSEIRLYVYKKLHKLVVIEGYDVVDSGRCSPTFRRNVLPPCSGSKSKASKHLFVCL
jgi:hypothetical protein